MRQFDRQEHEVVVCRGATRDIDALHILYEVGQGDACRKCTLGDVPGCAA